MTGADDERLADIAAELDAKYRHKPDEYQLDQYSELTLGDVRFALEIARLRAPASGDLVKRTECVEIAHRYCWLPAVGVRQECDASRIEDEIRALSGTAPPSGWRPIETVPKDGMFLGWHSKHEIPEVWLAKTFWLALGKDRPPSYIALHDDATATTLWQLLPSPPTEER